MHGVAKYRNWKIEFEREPEWRDTQFAFTKKTGKGEVCALVYVRDSEVIALAVKKFQQRSESK